MTASPGNIPNPCLVTLEVPSSTAGIDASWHQTFRPLYEVTEPRIGVSARLRRRISSSASISHAFCLPKAPFHAEPYSRQHPWRNQQNRRMGLGNRPNKQLRRPNNPLLRQFRIRHPGLLQRMPLRPHLSQCPNKLLKRRLNSLPKPAALLRYKQYPPSIRRFLQLTSQCRLSTRLCPR